MRLLVVEDEENMAASLMAGLRQRGHEVIGVSTGGGAIQKHHEADLVLLDLELQDMDGLEVCRVIRATGDTPIIAFTERSTESDRVLGLQAGSDDCLSKPYGFRELIARIDTVMRRTRRTEAADSEIVCGPLHINPASREVWLDDILIDTTRKEFDLLYRLAREPGVVVSRRQLMKEIWGAPMSRTTSTRISRTIDTHVSTLRGKLGSSEWIKTVRGVGFCLPANENVHA
ncbi:response regulator transcription factor [Actinopolyspora mortivallis]|uniref:DNA-binding response regulator n=1 Tax=Actinopolyspora mortivallis TaxID=33906 RepID=A0A2T0GYV2_ACTMO|nr:response regulator transcription factor [Actinopolyspora mortivallis]PRW64281.1 DNA-binding response regulator [Actinopolyspora mortivallis]